MNLYSCICHSLKGYDQKISPQAPTAFATAAFRFGHTLIDEKIRRADYHYNFDDSLKLSEVGLKFKRLYLAWYLFYSIYIFCILCVITNLLSLIS